MNKIILIDDNKSNQRAIYGASFVDNEEYEDCLVHKEHLNENSDYSFLDDAVCVLLHDSLADFVDGQFVSGGRMAKEFVMEKIKANNIPYVVFSDGHSIIGDWSQTKPDVVASIKKSEFYRNLRGFLDAYRETDHINLRIIAYGNEFEKRELIYLLQQIFDELNLITDKDILNISSINKDLIERFFDRIELVSNNITVERLYDSIKAGRLTVGKFKAYINSLASHAIKYKAKVPKNNILLLGNELSQERMSNLDNVTFRILNTYPLGEKGEKDMFDNISSSISSNIDAIIIDIDSTKNPDACLSYALAIRLSLHEIKKAALAPIIFMSSMTMDIFQNSLYSSLLQTKGVSFETPLYTPTAVELMKPLSPIEYKAKFLDIIKIIPNAIEGRHSIANQWGADVLCRIVIGNETNNELIKKARLSLYFRYVRALSLGTNEIENIIQGVESPSVPTSLKTIDAAGKNILLIDDEADKGWDDVLRKILPNSVFKTIQEQVPDYESLSDGAKKTIESGKYDLIFLDLRMNGVKEEDTLQPNEFSGMKILSSIKKLNKGNQVIMFTASNKAWNMKALLDAGADGYYIKESPEYAFPTTYSVSNANELVKTINRCLKRGYLRDVARHIKQFKKSESTFKYDDKLLSNISIQLDVAYSLITSAITQQQFAFAYISLEQVFEIITDELIVIDNYHYIIDETQEDCKDWVIDSRGCFGKINIDWKEYPQWKKVASLYYQLWNGTDISFGKEIKQLIEKRNAFIHNDKDTLNKTDSQRKKIHTDIYREDGFIRLFQAVKTILQYMY
ncbi:MAG: response regulator transcription factor [Bacteroidaceae bacterium]|nr:response regulator transcription factor [Bacteroidaceae bacterium]